MDATTIVILAGAAVAALGILVFRLGKRLAIFLLALGVVGVAGAVAYALAAQASATRQVARVAEVQAVTTAGLSAATSLIAFLLAVIVALLLAIVGAVVGFRWWAARQKRQQFAQMAEALQLYALLDGARLPTQRPAPALPYQTMGSGAGSVIVLPGQGAYSPQPGISLEDLARALQAAQGCDSFANLLPPEGGEWEVVE